MGKGRLLSLTASRARPILALMRAAKPTPLPPQQHSAATVRTGWRVLMALAFLVGTLFLNVHALEHIDSAQHADCAICLIGSGLDHAAKPHSALPSDKGSTLFLTATQPQVFLPVQLAAYHSRAPPLAHIA